MKELSTEININAPAEVVWKILTDFEKYPEWNPFIQKFKGEVRVGSYFEVEIHLPGGKPMTFKPVCLSLDENRELRWLGSLWFKGLFDGEHIFELNSIDVRSMHFVQREKFNGILVPLLWKNLSTKTRAGFEAMNVALKHRAESIVT